MSISNRPASSTTVQATPARHGTPTSAAKRRGRYSLQTLALLLAITAACLFAGVIADRFPYRVDTTGRRIHDLSQRTQAVVSQLQGPHEIVVVANFAAAEPLAVERTQDLLDAFARSSENLKVSAIDVASVRGNEELDEILKRLVARYEPDITRATEPLLAVTTKAKGIADGLEVLAADLLGAHDKIADADQNAPMLRKYFSDTSTISRLSARELVEAAEGSRKAATQPIGRTPMPALDAAAATIRKPLATLLTNLSTMSESMAGMEAAAPDAVPDAVRERSKALSASIARIRGETSQTIATLDDTPRVPLTAVARVLEGSSAAVVIGPPAPAGSSAPGRKVRPTVTAVDVNTLLPPRPPVDTPAGLQMDLRAKGEELLSGALTSLTSESASIVMIVHGASEAERLSPTFAPLKALVDRLQLRGIDVAEWAAGVDAEPPALTKINADGARPVVYVTIPTNASTPDGAVRMGRLAKAIAGLVREGKPLLLSNTPSTLVALGQSDPMVSFLAPLGLTVDTAHPLLQKFPTQNGQVVSADLIFTQAVDGGVGGKRGHAIAGAFDALRTHLPWCLPIRIDTESKSIITPLIVQQDEDSVWGESEWLGFRQTPQAQRSLLVNPPTEDDRDDGKGPWVVATALEREMPGTGGSTPSAARQRLVVVGSNGWFFDDLTQTTAIVEAQRVSTSPGNLELFEASVYWLAGQDSLIARSPQAEAVPLIPSISPGMLNAIRWGLIAGLPLAVLLAGAVLRLVRG